MANLPENIDMIIQELKATTIPNIGPMPKIIEGPDSHIIVWTGFNPYEKSFTIDNQDVLNQDLMFRNENPVEELDFRWVKKILICSEWKEGTILNFKRRLVESGPYGMQKLNGYKFTWQYLDELKYSEDFDYICYFVDEKGYLWTQNRDKYELLKINCKYNNEKTTLLEPKATPKHSHEVGPQRGLKVCSYMMQRGPKKGETCGSKFTREGTYCYKHKKYEKK